MNKLARGTIRSDRHLTCVGALYGFVWALRATALFFVLSMTAPLILAQQGDDQLFLAGTELRLGMPEGAVMKSLVSQGVAGQYSLQVDKSNPNTYLVMERNLITGLYDSVGAVKFTNGRLAFASKRWTSECNDIIGALHAILSKSRPGGEGTAWFKADTLQEPGISTLAITLAVGKRRISISSGTVKEFGKFISVDEAIGAKNIP